MDLHHAWAARAAAKPLNKGQLMPRAASCAALVLGAVQAKNCIPAAQAEPNAAWPRDDGGSRALRRPVALPRPIGRRAAARGLARRDARTALPPELLPAVQPRLDAALRLSRERDVHGRTAGGGDAALVAGRGRALRRRRAGPARRGVPGLVGLLRLGPSTWSPR